MAVTTGATTTAGIIRSAVTITITATTTASRFRKTAGVQRFARRGFVYRSSSCPSASTLNPRASIVLAAAPPLSSAGFV